MLYQLHLPRQTSKKRSGAFKEATKNTPQKTVQDDIERLVEEGTRGFSDMVGYCNRGVMAKRLRTNV